MHWKLQFNCSSTLSKLVIVAIKYSIHFLKGKIVSIAEYIFIIVGSIKFKLNGPFTNYGKTIISSDTAKGLEIQCEFDEDLRMTVHWNYIGDCTSKNLSWTEDILWRSDPESYIEGEKYFGYDEGNSGPSVTDFIPYTEYQFLVQLSAIEFSEQHNCTSPQEGETN